MKKQVISKLVALVIPIIISYALLYYFAKIVYTEEEDNKLIYLNSTLLAYNEYMNKKVPYKN